MAKEREDFSNKKSHRKRSQSSKSKTDDHVKEHDSEAVVTESVSSGTNNVVQLGDVGKDGIENKHEDDVQEEAAKPPKRKRKRKRKSKQEDGTASSQQQEGDDSKLSSLDLTVYVEGIPFDCSEEDVRDFFVSNGCEDILQLRLPR